VRPEDIVTVVALHARAAPLPPPQHDPDSVRQLAHDILSRSEFRQRPPGLFERVARWLSDVIARIFDSVGGGGGNAFGWVVLVVAVGVAIYAIARTTRTVRRDPVVRESVAVESGRSAAAWRDEADSLEAAGRWKDALRCRYRALIVDLVTRGVVEDVAGRTSGEYRRDVTTALPAEAVDFAGATELFERAWYGDEPTGASESARFRSLADRVVAGSR
jgi:hypothetical protein